MSSTSTQNGTPVTANGHANGHADPAVVPLNMQGMATPPPKTLPVDADTLNGSANPTGHGTAIERIGLHELDPARLTITLTPEDKRKALPRTEDLVFGQLTTDHMFTCSFDPEHGWGVPEIKPYGPFTLDPSSSCFQYCPTVFEGMKAYLSPSGDPVLFRPELNMARMQRSLERVALPPFNPAALIEILKTLVRIEQRWIPREKGCSLYIRPTVIGTRASLGVSASDHALLYIILSPTGPYFKAAGAKPVSLLGVHEHARSWPGGTGGFKLGLNYAPGFLPQRRAAEKGYQQVLWLLNERDNRRTGEEDNHLENLRITEAGAMNFFVARRRADGDLDIVTPHLDGTILPGITRQSCIELMRAHSAGRTVLPGLKPELKMHIHERALTMADLVEWERDGTLAETFAVGTAVIVCAVGRIGYTTPDGITRDVMLPEHPGYMGLGPVGNALWERIIDVQDGRVEWEGWSVRC